MVILREPAGRCQNKGSGRPRLLGWQAHLARDSRAGTPVPLYPQSNPMRLSRAAQPGAARRRSNFGVVLRKTIQLARSAKAFSNHSRAKSVSSKSAYTVAISNGET